MSQHLNNALAAALAPQPPRLVWQFRQEGYWWLFRDLDTRHPQWSSLYGVYIVTASMNVLKVGQGWIMDRLYRHQGDTRIADPKHGVISVAWAQVSTQYVDGVERYLADELSPLIGDAYPDVKPIAVNLPLPFVSGHDRMVQALMNQYRAREAIGRNPYLNLLRTP